MSQQEVADLINKTRALVSHVENTGKVNHHTLKLFAKIFKMTIEEIEDFNFEQKNNIQTNLILKDNEELKKENVILKELVESQKKIITLLEQKRKK